MQASERTSSSRGAVPQIVLFGLFAAAIGSATTRLADGQNRPRLPVVHTSCARFAAPDPAGSFLASDDVRPPVAPMDGDDLLTLVNRSPRWTLSPSYVPSDLVDVRTMLPTAPVLCRPPDHQCLRREAALALREMMAAMRRDHQEPYIDSAYRGYEVQCNVFQMWAYRDHHGFCNATVFSALPGHSQHQLGTAIDLFSRAWVYGGERFREGFGCSPGGQWIAAHGWSYGFVLPYPLHPDYRLGGSECSPRPEALGRVDPRTGYKYEPWHVRFIGVENAARFHAAWVASGPGTANEITLEQWLRERLGAQDPVEPPVCDGCTCGNCATFHEASEELRGPCHEPAMVLTRAGTPTPPSVEPVLADASIERVDANIVRVRATIDVALHTLTQPPIVNARSEVRYGPTQDASHLVVVPGGVVHAYPSLPGAWRIAIAPAGNTTPPWTAALVDEARDAISNGINARIPASTGRVAVDVQIMGITAGRALDVSLLREGHLSGTRTVHAP